MKGEVNIFIIIGIVALVLLLLTGIASNWSPVSGDVFGVFTFFNALATTMTEMITVSNVVLFTTLFFVTQGIFLYAYYKIGRFVWVRVPEVRKWFDNTKNWLSGL